MSGDRLAMIATLKRIVVPKLRQAGFSGSFPHFRRNRDSVIDLLTFQFSRWGGSFVVEVASCPSAGVTMRWGEVVSPNKVNAHHINYRLRLGANPPKIADHWFDFESATYGDRIYEMAAESVVAHLPQANRYWEFQR
jgi:hypothetical protein